MNDKKGMIVGLAIVAVLFAVAFPWGRHVIIELAVQDKVLALGRFPDANLIGSVEERDMGVGGVWLYVTTEVDYGKTVTRDHRIETAITPDFYEALEEQGVEVTRVVGDGDQ